MKPRALLVVLLVAAIVLLSWAQASQADNATSSPSSPPPATAAPSVPPSQPGTPAQPATPAKGLHFVDAPAAALKLVTDQINIQRPGLSASGFVNGLELSAETVVTIEPPLAEYATTDRMSRSSTNSFPSGNLDADTTLSLYYYPLTVDDKEVRSISIEKNAATGDFRLSMSYTPSPLIRDAVKKVATLSAVQAGSFEVRLLVYGRDNPALWLKSTAGGADLIYVIDPFRSPTNQPQTVGSIMNDHTGGAGQLYMAADFIAKIRGAASVVPLVTVAPIAPVPASPVASAAPAPTPAATTMSATVVSTGTPPPGATTISGTFEFRVGAAGGSLPLTITVGQEAVVALGNDGISVHINSRIGPNGNILCQSSFQLADPTGHVREVFASAWRTPSPSAPLTLQLRDLSFSFTPAPGSATAPTPAPTLSPALPMNSTKP